MQVVKIICKLLKGYLSIAYVNSFFSLLFFRLSEIVCEVISFVLSKKTNRLLVALSQVCDPLFQRNYRKVPNVTPSKLQGLDPSTDEFTLADILISTLFSKNKRTKNKQTGFQERALFYLSCQLRREIISPVAMRETQNQLRRVQTIICCRTSGLLHNSF